MAKILSGSIDLNKVDKSKIVTKNKEGQDFKNGAKYLNVQVSINDEPDQYENDASISINQSKQEREDGQKRIYIGNLKQVWSNETKAEVAEVVEPENKDDLPF